MEDKSDILQEACLFGVRSPIVVEYEETLKRCGIKLSAGISVSGIPRLLECRNIVALDEFNSDEACAEFYACAFNPSRRLELAEKALKLGLKPAPPLVDPSAVIAGSTRLGRASFINSGAIIGAGAFIGDFVLVNRAASIGHHALLEDFVSIGPGATLAGNIRVGENSVIGVGATILPDVRIGKNVVVAGGSLVRKNVEDDKFVAGNPAVERAFNIHNSSLSLEDGE